MKCLAARTRFVPRKAEVQADGLGLADVERRWTHLRHCPVVDTRVNSQLPLPVLPLLTAVIVAPATFAKPVVIVPAGAAIRAAAMRLWRGLSVQGFAEMLGFPSDM